MTRLLICPDLKHTCSLPKGNAEALQQCVWLCQGNNSTSSEAVVISKCNKHLSVHSQNFVESPSKTLSHWDFSSFPVWVAGFLTDRESLSWILVYLNGMILFEKIWQSNIWLISQGNYPLNLLPQYVPCQNELIHISWFTQENTLVVKSWQFLHWARNFFCSTMTMDLPCPFNFFY